MAVSKKARIAILEIHRDNLKATTTFEQYRDAHVAYVDMLVKEMKGELDSETAIMAYVEWKPNNV